MPRYVYECEKCNIVFQIRHSIKDRLTDCKDCNTNNSLQRIPSMPITLKQGHTGKIVKSHIEDAKKELAQEKRRLTKEELE